MEKDRIKTLETYALITSFFTEKVSKSMDRPFWYLRPSHTKLMRLWEYTNIAFDEYLKYGKTPDKNND